MNDEIEDGVRKGVEEANKGLIVIVDQAVKDLKAHFAENPSILEGLSDELRKRWGKDS